MTAREILLQVARHAMEACGLWPEYSSDEMREVESLRAPAAPVGPGVKDLRSLLWASIDNDDSLDLDQLTVAQALPAGAARVMVAVSDVDGLVKKNSAIDAHAAHNTTSIYTPPRIFSMLPEKLSTDLTSLNYGADRPAIVVDMVIDTSGVVQSSSIYPALVRNQAKLAYNAVAAWLEGQAEAPAAIQQVPGLADNLRLQDAAAQKLRARRFEFGALDLQTVEVKPVLSDTGVEDLQLEEPNRAKTIIEDFMIATNDVVAQYLKGRGVPSLRRVVRVPRRWDRMVEVAAGYGFKLPGAPDAVALSRFLTARREADPVGFPDLSLIIIKLMGPGEYILEMPGDTSTGHFALAVKDYTHSTAPNRRFSDLVTQRILKGVLGGTPLAYVPDELSTVAADCTSREDDARKVERHLIKSAAALLLSSRIGDRFDAICTGAADKGTWVRIFEPPVEGRLAAGFKGVDVGDRLSVELVSTDVERGFIDFKKATPATGSRRNNAHQKIAPVRSKRGPRRSGS